MKSHGGLGRVVGLGLGVVLAAGVGSAAAVGASAEPLAPVLGSSFIQAEAAVKWSDSVWASHFDQMDRAGMEAVILNVSINTAKVPTADSPNPLTAYYPTSLPGYTPSKNSAGQVVDVVGKALAAAQQRGMKVWIGLQFNAPEWWGNTAQNVTQRRDDAVWRHEQTQLSGKVAADLLDEYAAYDDVIQGWYLPWEDTPWGVETGIDNMQRFYGEFSTELDALDASKDILISPYDHPDSGKTSAQFTEYLTGALRGTSIDVVAIQTCADHSCAPATDRTEHPARAAVIAEWVAAVEKGVDGAGIGAEVWANVELFGPAGFGAVEDAVATMRAAQPFVDGFTSWSYTNHWSKYATWGASWWSDAYQAYVETGSVPTGIPDVPADVAATTTNGQLTVSWTTPKGQQIAHLELLEVTPAGIAIIAHPWNNELSVTVPHKLDAEYLLRTRTAAGTRSPAVNVPTGRATQLTTWSVGAPYEADTVALTRYPDTGGTELTDGLTGTTYSNPAWQGREGIDAQSYTIDLGASRPVREITVSAMDQSQVGIASPAIAGIQISADSTHWFDYRSAPATRTQNGTDVDLTSTGLANARYVRVNLAGRTGWKWLTFLDEITIRG